MSFVCTMGQLKWGRKRTNNLTSPPCTVIYGKSRGWNESDGGTEIGLLTEDALTWPSGLPPPPSSTMCLGGCWPLCCVRHPTCLDFHWAPLFPHKCPTVTHTQSRRAAGLLLTSVPATSQGWTCGVVSSWRACGSCFWHQEGHSFSAAVWTVWPPGTPLALWALTLPLVIFHRVFHSLGSCSCHFILCAA